MAYTLTTGNGDYTLTNNGPGDVHVTGVTITQESGPDCISADMAFVEVSPYPITVADGATMVIGTIKMPPSATLDLSCIPEGSYFGDIVYRVEVSFSEPYLSISHSILLATITPE
jgi:hypothetical protein